MAFWIPRVRRGFCICIGKGASILLLLLIFASSHLFAVHTAGVTIDERIRGGVYKNYLATIVPAEFVDVLYIMTESNLDLGLLVLGIAAVESDWRYMVSHHPNSNGSIDLGPLGLNSRNLEDPDFMRRFASPEYADLDPNIYYMTTCINLIRGLCREYGDMHTALKVYNGGIHAVSTAESWAPLSQVTSRYADRVLRHCQTIEDRWDQYVHENAAEPRIAREIITEGAGPAPVRERSPSRAPAEAPANKTGGPEFVRHRIRGSRSLSSDSFRPGERHRDNFAYNVTLEPQKTTRKSRGFVYLGQTVSGGHVRDGPLKNRRRADLNKNRKSGIFISKKVS